MTRRISTRKKRRRALRRRVRKQNRHTSKELWKGLRRIAYYLGESAWRRPVSSDKGLVRCLICRRIVTTRREIWEKDPRRSTHPLTRHGWVHQDIDRP